SRTGAPRPGAPRTYTGRTRRRPRLDPARSSPRRGGCLALVAAASHGLGHGGALERNELAVHDQTARLERRRRPRARDETLVEEHQRDRADEAHLVRLARALARLELADEPRDRGLVEQPGVGDASR